MRLRDARVFPLAVDRRRRRVRHDCHRSRAQILGTRPHDIRPAKCNRSPRTSNWPPASAWPISNSTPSSPPCDRMPMAAANKTRGSSQRPNPNANVRHQLHAMCRLHAAPSRSHLPGTLHLRPRRHSTIGRRPRNRPANPPARRIAQNNNHPRTLVAEFARIRHDNRSA